MELKLITYKRDNHQKDMNNLRGTLSKEFETDSIEGLQKCKEILQKKYKDFENEIKDKRFRLDTQKSLAELKRRELDDLLKAEQNDSNLMNEMKKSREELATVLKQQQQSYEAEEIFNERLANLGDSSIQNAEKEGQEILSSYDQEEQKLTQELESKTQEISDLRMDMERLEQDFKQKKEKSDEINAVISEFNEKFQKKPEYEHNIKEIDSGLKDYNVDLEITSQDLSQSLEKQEILTKQIKRLNELRKIQNIKTQYEENHSKIKNINENYDVTRRKFMDGIKITGMAEKNSKYEENLEELSLILSKALETTQKEIKTIEGRKVSIEDKLKEILSFRNYHNKELQEVEKKLKNLEKAFQKVGLSNLLKSNQEIRDFEAQYKEIKQDLQNAEKTLIIMEFTQNDLQGFLLNKSKEKSKCEFCEQQLTKLDLERLEKTINDTRKPKGDKHQESLKEKIIGIRKEKEILKKRKADYEEFSKLKKKSMEFQQSFCDKETEKQELSKELENVDASLLKAKNASEKYEELLEIYGKLEGLEIEKEEKEKILKDLEKENPGIKEIRFTAEEKEMLGNSKIYESLEETMQDVKKHEKRKNRLMSEFQQYNLQKEKMIEYLSKLEIEENKNKKNEVEANNLKTLMQVIREDLPRKIARIKKLDNEKKSVEEQLVKFYLN